MAKNRYKLNKVKMSKCLFKHSFCGNYFEFILEMLEFIFNFFEYNCLLKESKKVSKSCLSFSLILVVEDFAESTFFRLSKLLCLVKD